MIMITVLIVKIIRLGDHEFYGPGPEFVLDTTKPFTVVTQVFFLVAMLMGWWVSWW